MRTQLFIENKEVELTDDVQFLLNKQFEELSNPTVIINDWSKTVSIPFTESNNRLFGYIYRPDKIIITTSNPDAYKYMYMYFDPTKKLDFKLVYNNMVIMTGYAKMNEIKRGEGNGKYEVTLFGQLGRIFQEMKKITFDTATEDTNYLIDGAQYVNEYINQSLVYNSWTSDGQTHSNLIKKGQTGYNVNDILGWAPNNSFVSEFEYNTFQVGSNSSNTYNMALDESRDIQSHIGISSDSLIPNGFKPREVGDYRSYMQLPYIFFNKLFQIFKEKTEEITGYTFQLDQNWFNTANPYWYKLVYMLKQFDPKNGNEFKNEYNVSNPSGNKMIYNASGNVNYSPNLYDDSWHDGGWINLSVSSELMPIMTNNTLYLGYNDIIHIDNIPVSFTFKNARDESYGYTTNFALNDRHYPTFEISAYDENDTLIPGTTKTFGVTYTRAEGDTPIPAEDISLFNELIYTSRTVNCAQGSSYTYHINLPYNKTFTQSTSSTYKFKVRFKWTCKTSATGYTIPMKTWATDRWLACHFAPLTLSMDNSVKIKVDLTRGLLRSGVNFILNDLWNNDFNLFDEIIKYCKIYRIIITVDEYSKTIKFTHFKTFFNNYSIIDWTNKLDKNKEVIIKPITFENKYVLFNYDDNKTNQGEQYKKKCGYNYGEYRLTTDYNFNTETKKLFDKIKTSMTFTPNILSYLDLYYYNLIYKFLPDIFVYCNDKDDKQTDVFGSYYFHNGKRLFAESSNVRTPYITDDTEFQQNTKNYFYSRTNGTQCTSYPNLDIVNGQYMCLFSIPKEDYTYAGNYAGKKTIYKLMWENYINERYNIQNKQMTCYLKLESNDWINFSFNNFVKIENQLYIVNKIYDYDISEVKTTKVDLITVSNINGYIDNSFFEEINILTPHQSIDGF